MPSTLGKRYDALMWFGQTSALTPQRDEPTGGRATRSPRQPRADSEQSELTTGLALSLVVPHRRRQGCAHLCRRLETARLRLRLRDLTGMLDDNGQHVP